MALCVFTSLYKHLYEKLKDIEKKCKYLLHSKQIKKIEEKICTYWQENPKKTLKNVI